jgi:hypothetical protein
MVCFRNYLCAPCITRIWKCKSTIFVGSMSLWRLIDSLLLFKLAPFLFVYNKFRVKALVPQILHSSISHLNCFVMTCFVPKGANIVTVASDLELINCRWCSRQKTMPTVCLSCWSSDWSFKHQICLNYCSKLVPLKLFSLIFYLLLPCGGRLYLDLLGIDFCLWTWKQQLHLCFDFCSPSF